jgi:hypothetical protein
VFLGDFQASSEQGKASRKGSLEQSRPTCLFRICDFSD